MYQANGKEGSMSNLNSVNLIGRLTRSPETKIIGTNNVCEFSVAFDIGFGDKKKTAFIECSAWQKNGDFVQANFDKGKEILIEGRLDYQQWEDKDTKKMRSKISIVANRCGFVGGKSDSSNSGSASTNNVAGSESEIEIPF